MQLSANIALFAATAILIAGVVDDLRSQKFHNWLFLACSAFGLAVSIGVSGWNGLFIASVGFAAGIVIPLPLVLLKSLGAGDMKLLAAFGLVAGWEAVLSVAILSLFWGAAFGVIRTIINGNGKVLANNMMAIVTLKERQSLPLHRMPYTVALFVGWLSHLVYEGLL